MANGKKYIFYDKQTGDKLVVEGRSKLINMPSIEDIIAIYPILFNRLRSSFDVLTIDFNAYQQDFAECISYRVNPETKELEFSYPDPNEPEEPPVFQKPLTEQILELKEEQDKTKRMLSDSYSEQQLLIELLIDMGVL